VTRASEAKAHAAVPIAVFPETEGRRRSEVDLVRFEPHDLGIARQRTCRRIYEQTNGQTNRQA
jgi:hypothetical protein